MKKSIVTMLIICILSSICGMSVKPINDTYMLHAVVISVDKTTDSVVVVDDNGEAWEMLADGYSVGDACVLTMATNGTQTVYDDSIIDCQ